MGKLLKQGNTRAYLYIILAGILLLVWTGADAINAKLAALPITKAPIVRSQEVPFSKMSIHPISIKQPAAIAAEQGVDVEQLFKKEQAKVAEEPPKPVDPDFGAQLKQRVEVTSVADSGAVINGTFYRVGSKLEDLTMQSVSGKPVVPVLEAVNGRKVTIRAGKAVVVAQMLME